MPSEYPSIHIDAFLSLTDISSNLENKFSQGNTVCLIKKGKGPMVRRRILLRPNKEGMILFFQASSTAYRIGILKELHQWYEKNCNWKEGEYVGYSESPELN